MEKDRLLLTLIALKDSNSICRKKEDKIEFKCNGISYTPIYGDMNVYDGYVLLSFDFFYQMVIYGMQLFLFIMDAIFLTTLVYNTFRKIQSI